MKTPVGLTLTGAQHLILREHLYPGDNLEAVALLACGRCGGNRRQRLVVREVHCIPHADCTTRTSHQVTWPTEVIEGLLERAADEDLSIVKVHSHPGGYAKFSNIDDTGDARLLPMIRGWIGTDVLHGSAVMLPDGQMFGRVLDATGSLRPIDVINVVGDELQFWYANALNGAIPDFAASHAFAFDAGTIERLQRLSICVVGCSGTGSIVVELLMRLGVGEMVLIDDDHMEPKNTNRILNSTLNDARLARSKVDVLADAIERAGLGTRVIRIKSNLWSPYAVRAAAQCDIVFGCVDTIDGRYLLNTLATWYNLAYFDLGIRLVAQPDCNGRPHIREVCGSVHFLQPGLSSLLSRGVFSMEDVAAAGLQRTDPKAHTQQLKDGYIRGAQQNRPAVISVNMFAASTAVNEMLARLHVYREEHNSCYAHVEFSLASMELFSEAESGICPLLSPNVGRGDVKPLLGLLALAERRVAA